MKKERNPEPVYHTEPHRPLERIESLEGITLDEICCFADRVGIDLDDILDGWNADKEKLKKEYLSAIKKVKRISRASLIELKHNVLDMLTDEELLQLGLMRNEFLDNENDEEL